MAADNQVQTGCTTLLRYRLTVFGAAGIRSVYYLGVLVRHARLLLDAWRCSFEGSALAVTYGVGAGLAVIRRPTIFVCGNSSSYSEGVCHFLM